jgi:peptidase M15-like protein
MRKKWWYQWGLQTQVLIAILCLTQYAFAVPLKTKIAGKGKPGATVKSHKSRPATFAPVRSQTKTDEARKQSQEVRKKRSLAATKAASISSPTKTVRPQLVTKGKRTAKSQTNPHWAAAKLTERRHSRLAKASAPKNADRKHRSQFRTTTGRRVLVWKETRGHKYRKAFVTMPPSTRRPVVVFTPTPTPAILPAEQIPSPPFPPSALIAPVSPPQESDASSETTLAGLKKPETVGETNPDWHQSGAGYTSSRPAFVVKFNGERLLYRLNSAFVLPGDEIFVEVVDPQRRNDYTFRTTLEKERQLGPTRWYWNAPSSPGVYPIKVQPTRSNATVTLHVFVMVPLDRVEDGVLNGYRIGHYPTVALRQQPIYTPPRGLIEVTRENENMLVSPHFRLQQFLCKQEGDYPKYLALDARLLTALELLLEKANVQGYHARTFTVMSGYRTPYYNRAIGNSTTYSRHLWGDAADIFIDENPQDGLMDDLNQDGAVDSHDAEVLYDLIESEYDSRFQKLLVGGLARYRETSSHGPFVHVDVRGVVSRWGARSTAKGTTPSTLPVALRGNDLPYLPQPSYWGGDRETDSAP